MTTPDPQTLIDSLTLEVQQLRAETRRCHELIDGLSELVKVSPDDVRAVADENTSLREREVQHRMLAKAALDQLRNELVIRGSFCNYCKEAWTSLDGMTPDQCAEFAREHDKACSANPLTAELARVTIERDHMRPVFAAALVWRDGRDRDRVGTAPPGGQRSESGRALIDAVDVADPREPGDGYCQCGERLSKEHSHG